MFETYFIYISLFIFCCSLSSLAARKNNKKLLIGVIIALTFVAGFRSYAVGKDTVRYAEFFQFIADGTPEYAYGLERSFKILCALLLKIFEHPSFLLLFFAAITNTFILLRLWDFRKTSSMGWMTACYYIAFYFYSYNVIRQMCAVAIIFFATRYIIKRKYLVFLVYTAGAFIFHKSALIGMGFFAIEIFQWKYLNKKQRKFIACMLILFPLCIAYALHSLASYRGYFENPSLNIGVMIIAKLCLFYISSFGLTKHIRQISTDAEKKNAIYELGLIRISYLIGLGTTAIGYLFLYMERIGLMYYIFECVYWGMIVKITKNRNIYKVILFFLLCYQFLGSLVGGGQGEIPYTFIWQNPQLLNTIP